MVYNVTTYEGKNAIAKYFGVDKEWKKCDISASTPVEGYFQFLLLVKTKSKRDTLWIIFIEGLHRHATMVMCFLCSSFNFENNFINPGTLNMEDFNKAKIPHFKKNDHTPTQQLNNIMERRYKASMLIQFTHMFQRSQIVPTLTN